MKSSKHPIKIMFVSHSYALFGAERSLLTLLRNINNDIFEPHVVLPKKGELEKEIKKLNIKIHILKIPWWVGPEENSLLKLFSLLRCILLEIITSIKLCRIIKNEKIDIIYTNTIVIFSGAIAAFLKNKPHIWHVREIISKNPDLHFCIPTTKAFEFITNKSVKIITNSNATANQFYGIGSKNKIKVIYNAVNLSIFQKKYSYPMINGISSDDWITAVIGSLQKLKAQNDAIQAIKIVCEKIPNIKLLIIGDGNNEYLDYLKNISRSLKINDKVIFTGFRKDIPDILSYCKVLLLPSLNESFGRVAIEAMAAGIPVIGSNCSGIKEIIIHGKTGYLVPPNAPEKIAEKILYLYSHPQLAKDMGRYGKKVVKHKFCVENYVKNIEEIILEETKRKN